MSLMKRLGCTESRVWTMRADDFARLPVEHRDRASRNMGFSRTIEWHRRNWDLLCMRIPLCNLALRRDRLAVLRAQPQRILP